MLEQTVTPLYDPPLQHATQLFVTDTPFQDEKELHELYTLDS